MSVTIDPQHIVDAVSDAVGEMECDVNIFQLEDGSIVADQVSGSWGHGEPANPDQYQRYWLGVPAGHVDTVDGVIEHLD